jgi:hypothetical protein
VGTGEIVDLGKGTAFRDISVGMVYDKNAVKICGTRSKGSGRSSAYVTA